MSGKKGETESEICEHTHWHWEGTESVCDLCGQRMVEGDRPTQDDLNYYARLDQLLPIWLEKPEGDKDG